MSERLPYEDQLKQQWNDIPLPDENMAWEDMRLRLEKDDENRPVVWWLRGCAFPGLFLLLLLAVGWWQLRPDKWLDGKLNEPQRPAEHHGGSRAQQMKSTEPNKNEPGHLRKSGSIGTDSARSINNVESRRQPEKVSSAKAFDTIANSNIKIYDKKITAGRRTVLAENKNKYESVETSRRRHDITGDIVESAAPDRDSLASNAIGAPITENEIKDSVKSAFHKDSVLSKPSQKKDSSKRKTFYYSAGVALQQQLPLDGQKATPYNSFGRKGTLLDYIPSVYMRLNRPEKWFIQAEFKYGAPAYTREFIYEQIIAPDTAQNPVFTTTTVNKLKKTYYHQLPLTFNYYILPNWSLGAGVIWNKFTSAISEQEVNKRNNITQTDSFFAKKIVLIDKRDTFSGFAKSYLQAVFEAQYQWKRLSAGVRYSFGMKPYIRFALPGEPQQQERNSSLQVLLRYELWRQKKK